jgi:hypothetical protein
MPSGRISAHVVEGQEKRGLSVVYWLGLILGTLGLVFGILLTQTPGHNFTFHIVVFSLVGMLFVVSVVLGLLRPVGHWFIQVILVGELILCLYGLWSVLT